MKYLIIFFLFISNFCLAQHSFFIAKNLDDDSTCFIEGDNYYYNNPTKTNIYLFFNCDGEKDTLRFSDEVLRKKNEPLFFVPFSLKLTMKYLLLEGCKVILELEFNTTGEKIRYIIHEGYIKDEILK